MTTVRRRGRTERTDAARHPLRRAPARLATWSLGFAMAAGAIAVTVIAGWTFHVEALRHVGPETVAMTFNGALCVLLFALTWPLPRPYRLAADAFVGVVAIASLLEYITDTNFGIDQLVFSEPDHVRDQPGRIAALTSVCLLLVVIGRVTAAFDRHVASQVATALAFVAASVAIFGYMYGVPALYKIGPFEAMSLNSAVAILLLSVALLLAIPRGAAEWALIDPGAGPMLLRRLLPVAVVGVPLLGWLFQAGERAGWYDAKFSLALMVVGSMLLILVFTWTGARELSRVDSRRLQAIAQLRSLADVLEERVQQRVEQVEAHNARIAVLEDRMQQRVAQVEAHNARIAVLEDRERIASDLHDLVVQQLFAAGMQLQGLAQVHDEETLSRRIDAVVDAIDSSIADLRASIFELRTGARELDLRTATERVVQGASMGLGFKPTLRFEGPVELASMVKDDLVAVLREALSNVARHAAASRVDVVLSVTAHDVRLVVSDDGVGVGEIARAGGTAHMRARAEQFGGQCTWRNNEPHGTIVEWAVPRENEELLGDAEDVFEARS